MKKLGTSQRLLWIWETICYSLIFAYVLQLVFCINMNISKLVIHLCSPTALTMLLFGELIYKNEVKWSKFKPHEVILPLVIFIVVGVYGIVTKSNVSLFFAVGAIIIHIFLIIVGLCQEFKKNRSLE